MILFRGRAADGSRLAIALFGVGLVGGRVARTLALRTERWTSLSTPWGADAMGAHVRQVYRHEWCGQADTVRTVWCAGAAGFAADEPETRAEFDDFRRTAEGAASRGSDFYLVSSAGGLFEGQRHVTRSSTVSPQRPYGALKLQQEESVRMQFRAGRRRIYRLATVYGPYRPGRRSGLVATLLQDARAGRTTTLTGDLSTLRDYVWADDVAGRIARDCLEPAEGPEVEVLASGKPSSIHEVIHHVTAVLPRAPRVRFAGRPDNRLDISFAAECLPRRWVPTDLRTAVRRLAAGCVEVGLTPTPPG